MLEGLRPRRSAIGSRLRRLERRELRAWLENTRNLIHLSALLLVPVLPPLTTTGPPKSRLASRPRPPSGSPRSIAISRSSRRLEDERASVKAIDPTGRVALVTHGSRQGRGSEIATRSGGPTVSDRESESESEPGVDGDPPAEGPGVGVTNQTPTPEILRSLVESGEHEMRRETTGLALSAFSAGLDIGFGPLLMAVVLTLSTGGYGDLGTELLLASVYSVGFIFVILGRSELFTEHTTLAVMPVLAGRGTVRGLARVWGVVYASNVVGGVVFTLLIVTLMPNLGVASPDAFEAIAHKLVDHDLEWLFVAGIFAGWLMGLVAWLVTAAQDTIGRILVVWIVTASIGILHLPHSIAGNVEVLFGLFLSPAVTFADYAAFLALSTLGNAIGGGVFVGLLKYGHVVRGGR